MNVELDSYFVKRLKKLNVKIRGSFKVRIIKFSKNPQDPQLNNHKLKREWRGHRSIDITADWRAIYKEIESREGIIAYFVAIGTHKELYKQSLSANKQSFSANRQSLSANKQSFSTNK
jgi:addiction module RelE/StbE family toxin